MVKAKKLFFKNPAQHYADMMMIEGNEEIKLAFLNPVTGKRKEIECIRVDGGGDEGPVHQEVQYWWTERHLIKETKAIMVTTKSSGSSYKNRVELQNGCLALGHANLFIPSTLNGSCMVSGQVDDDLLCKNLDSAIDVYISRVDQAPCARTVTVKSVQKEREIVLKFLKGKAEEKQKVKLAHPELFKNVEAIWQLRTRHMVKKLPHQYVFYLRCCFLPNCIHPVCKSNSNNVHNTSEDVWYPGGPSLDFFPSPTPDPDRPYGNKDCKECVSFCAGHYMKPCEILSYVKSGKSLPDPIPPSQVLSATFTKCIGFPTDDVINSTAKQVLLKPEDVKMWFQHLQIVQANRKKGAKKAAATRKGRKGKEVNTRTNDETNDEVLRDADGDEVCNQCHYYNPPCFEDEPKSDDELSIDWLACNLCALWYHKQCIGTNKLEVV